jgi:hypothetical protein
MGISFHLHSTILAQRGLNPIKRRDGALTARPRFEIALARRRRKTAPAAQLRRRVGGAQDAQGRWQVRVPGGVSRWRRRLVSAVTAAATGLPVEGALAQEEDA